MTPLWLPELIFAFFVAFGSIAILISIGFLVLNFFRQIIR